MCPPQCDGDGCIDYEVIDSNRNKGWECGCKTRTKQDKKRSKKINKKL